VKPYTNPHLTNATYIVYLVSDPGLSNGGIAGLVIACLFVVAGGLVFLVMWRQQDSRVRKLFGYGNASPSPQGGFDNITYDGSSTGGSNLS
jgi:hypothetical protein